MNSNLVMKTACLSYIKFSRQPLETMGREGTQKDATIFVNIVFMLDLLKLPWFELNGDKKLLK